MNCAIFSATSSDRWGSFCSDISEMDVHNFYSSKHHIVLGLIILSYVHVSSLTEILSPIVNAEDKKKLCFCIQNTHSNVNLKNEIIC